MNRTQARNWLTDWFAATPAAADLFDQALDVALVADSEDRGPAETGYAETVDQWFAAAAVAELLAMQAAQVPEDMLTRVQSEGTTLEVQGGRVDWWALAAAYRRRSPLTGSGLGIITVEPGAAFMPRSAGVPW